MVYIKKLVVKGFKSFAKETEIPFSNSMNVIVGPNGSGKSNITDAICFVLGRMSIKSMRAAKSSNLIFAGTKQYKPASEASVKLIFDNSDKKFPIESKELIIERIVRKNGQSIYRINNETKTRQEVIELLAQAGIDPYGFNIVLQGEISSVVKMHSEERRKVIEEVAGISIYELRKEKSLKEMEKTEERLKEVRATLRERTAYLKNLEEERKQALRYKKLQEEEKSFKASILRKKIQEKEKELEKLEQEKKEKELKKQKEKEKLEKIQEIIEKSEQEISSLNKTMQKASGIEQEALNTDISNIRAELTGLNVRKENNESKIIEIKERIEKNKQEIQEIEQEIQKLKKEFPSQAKKYQELDNKKDELTNIEKEKSKLYNLKEKTLSAREKLQDKEKHLQKITNESNFLLNEINNLSENLSIKDFDKCEQELKKLKSDMEHQEKKLYEKKEILKEKEKLLYLYNSEIKNAEEIKKQVSKLDICPLCKSKITKEHINHVYEDSDKKISDLNSKINNINIQEIEKEISNSESEIKATKLRVSKLESDFPKLQNIEIKNTQIKKIEQEKSEFEKEITELRKNLQNLESQISKLKGVEEQYEKIFLEIQTISSRSQENLNAELEFKQRDLTKLKSDIKASEKEKSEIEQDISDLDSEIEENESLLEQKQGELKKLEEKFRTLIEKRTNLEKETHNNNSLVFEIRNILSNTDSEINNKKVEIAGIDATKQNLEVDFSAFKNEKTINLPVYILEERLQKTKLLLDSIGSVNLRALEVYEKMKEEYDAISLKVETLEKEKLEIMKIIEEIDRKKKKTFMKTLTAINELFNRNFTQLSAKGQAFLELENKEEPFSAGLDILIKVAKGKYFDVTSLSGGEQTLVALSLIFAIQEYNPYCFYIFDEVDAALDKRNSERLAALVKRYMKSGQYIIVTHNDAIITESTTLYGVSMQEGVSKILSLEI